MIGLLMKDLMCTRKAIVLMIMVGIVISMAFNSGREAVVMIPTIIAASLVGTAQAYDDECGWESYASATGISRRKLVIEKYVLGLLTIVFGMLGGVVALSICNLIEPWNIDLGNVGLFYAIGFFGGYVSIGASLYIDHRFGSGYLGIVVAATIGAMAGLGTVAGNIVDASDLVGYTAVICTGLAVIDIILLLMNIRIIERKDL